VTGFFGVVFSVSQPALQRCEITDIPGPLINFPTFVFTLFIHLVSKFYTEYTVKTHTNKREKQLSKKCKMIMQKK